MQLPIMGIIGGATQIAGSLIGGGARRREARAAAAEMQAQKQALQDFQFTNEFAGLENVFEDATVNQQAAQFQGQQTDAALAQALQAATVSGGAPGGAQAIAQAALQSKAGISADIARQEQANQARRMQQESRLQQMEAQGGMVLQQQQYGQQQQLLNLASARKVAADQARAKATAGLVGGIGSVAGGIGTAAFAPGSFTDNLTTNYGGVPETGGQIIINTGQNIRTEG